MNSCHTESLIQEALSGQCILMHWYIKSSYCGVIQRLRGCLKLKTMSK